MKHTSKPPINVTQVFPFLAGREKTTIRLHPRPDQEPAINESKLGGTFLWPQAEPWPICTEPELTYNISYSPSIVEPNQPNHNDFYVGILQLRGEEFPEIEFPPQTNLLQLLWCPNDHLPTSGMACKLFWRNEEDIINPIKSPPTPRRSNSDLVPYPCCLYPERVIEYPCITELSVSEQEIIYEWEDKQKDPIYQNLLSTAPGIKIGGYPDWIQDPEVPICQCGKEMFHLLTVASCEFYSASPPRWCPIEDRTVWQEATRMAELFKANPNDEEIRVRCRQIGEIAAANQVGAKLTIGDVGSAYIFICRSCPAWPIRSVSQCG